MSILNIQTAPPTGQAAVTSSVQSTQSSLPSLIYILTSDTFATVTTTGYLTQQQAQGFTFSNNQMALVYTTDTGPIWLKVVITYSGATIENTVVSLVDPSNAGDVVLPTIANYIAHFTGTTGTISSAAANIINAGNIQAGLSGTAGTLISFPATAANGSLIISALNAGGAFNTTIRNSVMGQSSVVSIPDPGAATATFLLSTSSGGQSVAGGFTVSTGNLAVSAGSITASGAITSTAGNITSGSSGDAGTFIAFPATAANGTMIIAAGNAGGAFNTTITSGTIGQSTVYTVPDIGASTGGIVVSTSAIRQKVVAAAAAAGGNAAQSFTDAFCTSGSVVVGNWATQTTPASVLTIVPGTGSFVVTSSADAGVGTFSYTIYK